MTNIPVSNALMVNSNKTICRVIIFSKQKIHGFYRYKDEFQIFPYIFDNVPKSEFQDTYPAILEFKRDNTINDITIIGKGLWSKEDRIRTMLNTFTNNHFYKGVSPQVQLGYLLSELENGTPKLEWFMNHIEFPFENREMFFESFYNGVKEAVKLMEHTAYFMNNPDILFDREGELVLPETIDKLFESYFKLASEEINFVDTATDYITNSIELFKRQKTLSLVSSFTAIETMVNLEYRNVRNETCSECNQVKYRIRKKFTDFLLKYVASGKENKKVFTGYYDRRSKIIHQGERLKTENYFAHTTEEEVQEELNFRGSILQLGRLAINNWLLLKTVNSTE